MIGRIETKWVRMVLAGLSLALLGAAILLALPDGAGIAEAQGNTFKFKKSTPEWVGYCGGPGKIVKIRAVGLDKKRIRYSISGHSAFKISKKKGRIKYNGSNVPGGAVWLTITARDLQGEHANISHDLYVHIGGQSGTANLAKPAPAGVIPVYCNPAPPPPPPTATPSPPPPGSVSPPIPEVNRGACTVGMALNAGERCALDGTEVHIYADDGHPYFKYTCFSFARCTTWAGNSNFTKNGISIEKKQGKWTITSVP